VKVRRLERCRLDLRSPLHVQKSISDILFQWGFNDSASFSRAFREQYGVSPREYRKAPPGEEHTRPALRRGRPGRDAAPEPVLPPDEPESVEAVDNAAALPAPDTPVRHHHLPVSPRTIHWGYFSPNLRPALTISSGDFVTVETLTHHANDDPERMVEEIRRRKRLSLDSRRPRGRAARRRTDGCQRAGPGPGEGFGVHICTGPIAVAGAQPGDVIEVRILDLKPRASETLAFRARPSAAMPPPIGASTIRTS
jgi:hypothetical protein